MSLDDIIDEVMAPPPARGRRAKPITAVVRRQLNEGDIKALWDLKPGELGSEAPPLVRLRNQHHFLARVLAEGRPNSEAALLTGMDPNRISVLQNDPAFSELVKYYKEQVGEAYINVHERLAIAGVSSVEELMARLDETPESFTNRELMELSALGLDRSGHGPTTKQQVSVAVLSSDVLEKLKAELASRQNGTVRPLGHTQGNSGPGEGLLIEHEPVAEAEAAARSEGKGTDI